MLNPGTVIDRYVVESLIGTGGTAVVYRVRHKTLGTDHALKVLSVTSPTIRERMMREGKVQASLNHLNVVTVTDVLDVDGDPGLLMEHIDGPALDEALQRYRLDTHSAEVLFLGIVAGVRHAHRAGLVHRDLKPANVLLAPTDDGFVPKVTDFGLAKVLQSESKQTVGHTRAGVAMGTPAYMAPEQVRDASNVDQRADMFSLGCLLYELMTRHRAFPAEQALAVYNAVTDGAYRAPREIVPDLPDRIDQAIRGCLAVDRDVRIPDCDTLLEVLRGERSWEPPDLPTVEVPMPALRAPVDDDSGPAMSVAARSPIGGTPAPPSVRRVGPGGEVEVEVDGVEVLRVASRSDSEPSDTAPSDAGDPPSMDEERHSSGLRWVLMGTAAALVISLLIVASLGAVAWSLLAPSPTAAVPERDAEVVEAPSVVDGFEHTTAASERMGSADPTAAEEPADDAVEAATAPASPPPPASVERAPEPAPVTVKILSEPPTATVWVDGLERGRTPLKLDLSPGRHAVRLDLGGQEGAFSVQPAPGGTNRWCHAFADDGHTYQGSCPR